MNTSVVVDTDVVSYLFKSHPVAFEYLPDLKDRTDYLGVPGLMLISHGQ